MPLKNWYFATNVHGLRHAFNQIEGAVLSAKLNTTLVPHALVDDSGSDADTEMRVGWLLNQGVNVIRHRATLVSELIPRFGDRMRTYSGHWLRCDIPLIENEQEIVLYTDIDVIFEKDVASLAPRPKVAACGPEHQRGDRSYFNSGVMVLNVPAFGSRRKQMLEVLRSRLDSTAPYDDQSMLNELLANEWESLEDTWNWKPYWGPSEDALIVHWHGPKPNHVSEMFRGETSKFGEDYETIFRRNPEGYRYYLSHFERFKKSNEI